MSADRWEWAIQVTEVFASEEEAQAALSCLEEQGGYLGGRTLAPCPSKPDWRLQAFFSDDGPRDGWLPDGCRRVIVPPALARMLGFPAWEDLR